MREDVECPYCEKWNEINHDDGFGYEEDVPHEMQCSHCEKSFVFHTTIVFHYEAKKADCLNDSDHDWRKTHTFPECCSRMECYSCGQLRDLTEDERKQFSIGTIDEYMKFLNQKK